MRRVTFGFLLSLSALAIPAEISLSGEMIVSQGGMAVVQGTAVPGANGPTGFFNVSLSQGPIVSMSTLRLTTFFAPGITAGFEGVGVAIFREGPVSRTMAGVFHVYVDDLTGMTPPQPDQMIFTFRPKGGDLIVYTARMQRGDIIVVPE
jgi:hypothetical protein